MREHGTNPTGADVTMVNRWTGRETRLLRHALRLSVRAFAEDLGVSPRTVSKWESGGSAHQPRPELQAALDTMLRRADQDERSRFGHHLGWDMPEQSMLRAEHQPTIVARPQPASTVHEVIGAAAVEAATFSLWWEQASTGPASVELLYAELRRLAADYLDGPPEPVVLAVRDLRDGIFELLRRHQAPDHARDLHLAAGYACVLLSWFSGDLGQPGAADTHAQAGGLFVGTSGSLELQAWVQAARSKTALWSGNYQGAADEATAGLSAAPATGVRVLLAAQVADAWAMAGAQAQARASLDGVAAARDAVVDGDQVGGLLSCTPAREANYLSGIYQCIGVPDQAIATADMALRLSRAQPLRSYATEAQIRLNLVDVFLELGDLSAAAEAIRPVIGLPPQRRLHTLTHRVSRLDQELADRRFVGNDAAWSLRQQIADFVGEPWDAATA